MISQNVYNCKPLQLNTYIGNQNSECACILKCQK